MSVTGIRTRRPFLEYLLYIAIGLAFAGAVVWCAQFGFTGEDFAKWSGLFITTAIIYGATVARQRKKLARHVAPWLVLCATFVVHLGVYVVLFQIISRWSVVYFMPAYIVEGVALDYFIPAVSGSAGLQRGIRGK